jgi:hypothetical protein
MSTRRCSFNTASSRSGKHGSSWLLASWQIAFCPLRSYSGKGMEPILLDSLDSMHAIVGWTLLTVLAYWTPVAFVAYVLTS